MSDAGPISARLTAGGRGAVATVAMFGDCAALDVAPALFRAANGRPLASQPFGRVVFGHWGHDTTEEVVVCRLDAHQTEIGCHGGDAAVGRILSDVAERGWRIVEGAEFVRIVQGEFAAECAAAMSRATTARTAEILLGQSTALPQAFRELHRISGADAVRRIDELLHWARFGLHLTEPWKIVLAGRPNVGKSSLVNALVGYARSIVFDQPGTTRDVVTAETAYDGWPLRFADTAGIRDDADDLEAAGIGRSIEQVKQADLVLLLVDASQPPDDDDRQLAERIRMARSPHDDTLVIAHKSDLPDAWGDELPPGALRVSSRTGDGIDELLRTIVARLVPKAPGPTTAIPFADRHIQLLKSAREAALTGHSTTIDIE